MINSYPRDVSIYLKDNSPLISASKSTVTLFSRTNTSPRRIPILLLKTHIYHWSAVLKYWEWLWVHPYPSTSTATMCQIGSTREIICWWHWRDHPGDMRRRLLLTYNALGNSIASYTVPVWSTNASDSSFKKIQTAQHVALRRATVAHKMARSPSRWKSRTTQICFLRSTMWTVWRRTTSVMAS